MGCYVKKVWGYFYFLQILIWCQISMQIFADDFHDNLFRTNFEIYNEGLDYVLKDLSVDCFGASVYAVCKGISQDVLTEQLPENIVFDDTPLVVQNDVESSDFNIQNNQTALQSNIQGPIPHVVVTNPVGIIAVMTAVATVLVVDQISQMGLIDDKWSLVHLKEKIFGVKIYIL